MSGGPEGEEVLVEVTGLAPGGDAVGRQQGGAGDGRVTFVPLAAPGELVRVRLGRVRARVAWGELVEVLRPSELRVGPRCPLFGRCGGCQWQHVDDSAQRRAKGDFVGRALGREVGEAKAVGPAYGYRERARFTVVRPPPGPKAELAIGFRARRSHEVVDVPACPLLTAPLEAALPALRAWTAERFVAPAGEASLFVQGGRDGEVAGLLRGNEAGAMVRLAPGARLPELVDSEDRAGWPDVSEPGGRVLRVPPGAFAQVGQAGSGALQAAVAAALGPDPGVVLELHAGSGNLTRALCTRAERVVASDGDRAAVARGRLNVPEASWYEDGALPALRADTVIVDPPREGLDERAFSLAAAARRRLVYVSCDPQTLARDVKRLVTRGFRLEGAVALDLMPQTHHVEVVAVLLAAGVG